MQREEARILMIYYRHIPDMLKLFRKQKEDIELVSYNSIRAMGMDGMPHGSSVGNPTETYGIDAAENDTLERLKEIENNIGTLEYDAKEIRQQLDQLNGNYKRVVMFKLISGYSWPKVGMKLSKPESTCRYWLDNALDRLAECYETLPDKDNILLRASRAR